MLIALLEGMRAFTLLNLLALGLCTSLPWALRQAPVATPELRPAAEASAPADSAAPEKEPPLPQEPYLAALRLSEKILAEPSLPGAPRFEASRASLVARAKGEPVLFKRVPLLTALDEKAEEERSRFLNSRRHHTTVRHLLTRHISSPARLREFLLREGYFYTDDPERAFVLGSLVGPHHLFDEDEIWIHRGDEVIVAQRDGEIYRHRRGQELGEQAQVLHLDRIGTGPRPEPLHIDLRSLRARLAFDRLRVVHMTEAHLLVDLRYQERWVPSILAVDGAHLELKAEIALDTERPSIAIAKSESLRRHRALQRLKDTMAIQAAERLPFDEPKTEIGQEDGALRRQWRYAYLEGRTSYEYNGDSYRVFDSTGAPRVPQVCIDFVVDTFERAAGTWWRKAGEERKQVKGSLDLRAGGRDAMRRTKTFVDFAQEHEDWFEVLQVPQRERIAMGHQERFFEYLARRADDFQAGDVVLIRGMTPWDEEKAHSHVFIVYETDPITGIPILVAGNAGPANIWSWETEARRTPGRSVRYRIRPKTAWLEAHLQAPQSTTQPAPLLPLRQPVQLAPPTNSATSPLAAALFSTARRENAI